ncbi:RagB/SusD family nutrient uptake outer membrane protein [Mariniphaga sediminis]|uniref:RagB/SusD family nutrient uptake outer membrane protein n=1 Tax=Mariniphaga sediminis TaxID=1628158 RepID=A0A399D120_9BACT|nr:RagB/SusD family nutrient uptake outer membrane protein [Mariniphaga sediminis]RIH64888.1 RagB/SusD family nutrient uptake outer membrane protein [Mariniphaga sediminis]
MKKLIYIIILAVTFVGCDSFLDKRDPTATSFVEFFNDEEDLRRVIYSSYLDVFTHATNRKTLLYMSDGKSDNAYSRIEDDHHQRIANGNFNSNTTAFLYYYELQMKHLGRLNTFIANADIPYVEDEAVRQKYKSILEAMRVWHYFKLTFRWGNVPFHLEPADLTDAIQPATSKEEILDQLFPLAEEIASRLPADEYTTDKYMFNRYSLKALTMRYALYNGRYEMAARLAKEIMDSGNYSLHPVYGDLFQYDACSDNNEFIMHMNRESNGNRATYTFRDLGPHYRTGPGQSYLVPLKSLIDSYWTLQGRPIDECPLHTKKEYELAPSLNRDPRYSASIMGHGDDFYGEPIDIYNENNPMYYENQRASKSGYWFKKYVSESDAFKSSGNFEFAFLRYAEVLLTYAEAKIMLNNVDALAKSCINQVRERAGLDMTVADVTLPEYDAYSQQNWIDLIRNERRIEFAAEGLRYADIIRWRIAEEVLNKPALGHTREVNGELVSLKIEDRSFKSNNYLWPFHENSLRVNTGLKQNPGY